jgi:CubicO group peptidase (beta-lactamase class C family)
MLPSFDLVKTGPEQESLKGIDEQVQAFMKTWKIPGGAVAVTKNGKLIYNRGFGYSDQKRTTSVLPTDVFRLASVSKPITSIAIMKLAEEGKLSLNDTVFGKNKILDQKFYLGVISDKRIYSITVKDLLEHTAGWDRDVSCDGYDHSDAPFFPLHVTDVEHAPNPVGDSTLIRFMLRKGLNYSPGRMFAYSNVGYLVLGKVIEKISGKKYEDYVQQNIFSPLDIHSIHLGKNLKNQKLEHEVEYFCDDLTQSCYGYGGMVPAQYGGFNIEAMNAHGGWVGSAPDLCRLMLAVDGNTDHPDILNPNSIKQMSTASGVNPYYAKGWCVNGSNSYHTGSMDGTATYICKTKNGYTWAFLFNSRADNSDAFWDAFDRLPWNCLKTVKEFPDVNLFAKSNS